MTSRSRKSPLTAFVMVLLLMIAGVATLIEAISDIREARKNHEWLKVEGVIVSSGVKEIAKSTFQIAVEYRYQIGKRQFRGDQWQQGNPVLPLQDCEAWVASYKPGTAVNVYYHPDFPTQSVLVQGQSRNAAIMLFVSLFFLLMGTGIAVLVWVTRPKPQQA